MLIIGLTGSIGMGKSETARIFRSLGIPVHDSDQCIHDLYLHDAVQTVAKHFPSAINLDAVDRKKLADIVFQDEVKLALLESIIHPLVRARRQLFCVMQQSIGAKLVVLDIPLLFETKSESDVDLIVTVDATEAVQKSRVYARPGMTQDRFNKIMSRQMPSSEKRARSHFILNSANGLFAASHDLATLLRSLSAY